MCRWLGVDTIGIIENNVNVTTDIAEVLAPFVESGFVDLEAWGSDTPAQREAFDKCFTKYKDTHDWVAFFDADEYLMLLERCVIFRSPSVPPPPQYSSAQHTRSHTTPWALIPMYSFSQNPLGYGVRPACHESLHSPQSILEADCVVFPCLYGASRRC